MVKLDLKYGLPFCNINLSYNGECILIEVEKNIDIQSEIRVFCMDEDYSFT